MNPALPIIQCKKLVTCHCSMFFGVNIENLALLSIYEDKNDESGIANYSM